MEVDANDFEILNIYILLINKVDMGATVQCHIPMYFQTQPNINDPIRMIADKNAMTKTDDDLITSATHLRSASETKYREWLVVICSRSGYFEPPKKPHSRWRIGFGAFR
mmetsp:Transcript_12299/g.21936  ORF Transcript_12299/g.21936 Transcript_12299/m.21936 type:complete len:109 (-) Transcript_12299:679-1005(-)